MPNPQPTNADAELRRRVIEFVSGVQTGKIRHVDATEGLMQLVLADRKKHELEASIAAVQSLPITDYEHCDDEGNETWFEYILLSDCDAIVKKLKAEREEL